MLNDHMELKKATGILVFCLCMLHHNFNAQLPAYVPSTNLLGFWLFNGNANDLSGNNNNGIVNGALTTTDRFSVSSAAYLYNGSSDYITIPDKPMLSNHRALSISAWINPNILTGVQGIVCKWYQMLNCASHSDTYEGALTGNFVQFATNNTYLTGFSSPPAISPNDVNTWTHIVWMSDSLSGQFIYINGSLAGFFPATGKICSSINPIYFGADYDGKPSAKFFHRFFSGKIDDIGIWSRLLTECEIKQLYHASTGSISASTSSPDICKGASAVLTASGGVNYTWMPSGIGASLTVTPTTSFVYTVTAKDSLTGCLLTAMVQVDVTDCVGLGHPGTKSIPVFYPNPVSDELIIQLTEPARIGVVNATGKVVSSGDYTNKNVTVDLRSFPAGIYFVTVTGDKASITKKVVKE